MNGSKNTKLVTSGRRVESQQRLPNRSVGDRTQAPSISPIAVVIFIIAAALLGCYAQLGLKITMAVFGTPVGLYVVVRLGRASWNIFSALVAWEIDMTEDFALAQSVGESREGKLQRRLDIADHEAKWRLLLNTSRYAASNELRALMVHEADGGGALLHGQCLQLWNEDRKWGTALKANVKRSVVAYHKILSVGVAAVQRECTDSDAAWNTHCKFLCDQNHVLAYGIAKMLFPSRNLEVVDARGNQLQGGQALNSMRRTIRQV